jgi:hypothetical protein
MASLASRFGGCQSVLTDPCNRRIQNANGAYLAVIEQFNTGKSERLRADYSHNPKLKEFGVRLIASACDSLQLHKPAFRVSCVFARCADA